MEKKEIPYYLDYISPALFAHLMKESHAVDAVDGLREVGVGGGLESAEALQFLCQLYDQTKHALGRVLSQRKTDRQWIDQRTRACYELNSTLKIDFLDPRYQTIIGQEDGQGRIVMGPKNEFYSKSGYGERVAPIPEFLSGNHVTLFGPPDDAKLSINAMNAFHRKLKDEPKVVEELLSGSVQVPKWGADDEDSKTPLRRDLVSAGENLSHCFDRDLTFTDPKNKKTYALEKDHLSLPIKRFPGLALPCTFLFYRENPLPLHLYDFALHLFKNWHHPAALAFYVPKLENEEEAAYIHFMVEIAEKMLQEVHPEYQMGSIRLFIVLENPRAIFRVNEIMDALHPYFAGASLGWHDYLASTARVFKEDANYRIPVKADPNIVIKYIKASHDLLAAVVGSRGGIKIGGMYGVLPMDNELSSPSFQITMKGFIKDVITQMKRGLSGFWVAHPDFVRIGLALVEAWKLREWKESSALVQLVTALLDEKHHAEILSFIRGPDLIGLNIEDALYPRSLLVADVKESTFIANHDPEEIRYNVFQSLQYLADWLCGHGCVALPAQIDGIAVRVMDDLATAERSRWEVWHEVHHQRFSLDALVKIAHEEMLFIRKDRSDEKKIVQVKWNTQTEKWYPIAMKIMLQLMTAKKPVEFATELLLPFTVESVRNAEDPWKVVTEMDAEKYAIDADLERLEEYFSVCGSLNFAKAMAKDLVLDVKKAELLIHGFELSEIIEAASFHGDIGESSKTLDAVASKEQAGVLKESEENKRHLRALGAQYLKKFGFKYLVSAQGKSAAEIENDLSKRLMNPRVQELENAKKALWEISWKRLKSNPRADLLEKIKKSLIHHSVPGAQVSIATSGVLGRSIQSLEFGDGVKGKARVTQDTWFELASLSKTLASCFAVEYFQQKKIPLHTSVNSLFEKTTSSFRVRSLDADHPAWADEVTLAHLMNHQALNLHYVNGIPATSQMPNIRALLDGNPVFGYSAVGVQNHPGSVFQYSGGGFLVLEHLLESLEKRSVQELTRPFFDQLGLKNLSFDQKTNSAVSYAHGYLDSGTEVEGTRKMFPAFAAGAMGTALDYSRFLEALTQAYHSQQGQGPISHDTAIQLLHSTDRSSQKFMGVNIGLGVFIAEAGQNRFAIHQGANDGFRALSVHCYQGPDCGAGFVILCNADENGVRFVAEAAQQILSELKISGVDTSLFQTECDLSKVSKEEMVNQGYKSLVFGAFQPDLPEAIVDHGPLDPLASLNLAVGATILEVTNQRFARAENLLSPYLPVFDPELYGRQGKIMDSWESVRHNFKPVDDSRDELIFRLKKPSTIRGVSFSTQFHNGNHPQAVRVEGRESEVAPWKEIVAKTPLDGHAIKRIRVSEEGLHLGAVFQDIRVSMYPDGGLSRIGLFENMPVEEGGEVFTPAIPQAKKPLSPHYEVTKEIIDKNWSLLSARSEVDLANLAYGGSIISASNEHYGPAVQIISPYPPINMFDGSESARSRIKGHSEEVVIQLAKTSVIHRIEIDFTYFVNNNPNELSIEGLAQGKWVNLVKKTRVKAYAGNKIEFKIDSTDEFEQIKVTVFPDGGMNRVRVFGVV